MQNSSRIPTQIDAPSAGSPTGTSGSTGANGPTPPGPRYGLAVVVIVALFIVAVALLAHAS